MPQMNFLEQPIAAVDVCQVVREEQGAASATSVSTLANLYANVSIPEVS